MGVLLSHRLTPISTPDEADSQRHGEATCTKINSFNQAGIRTLYTQA